MSQNTALIGEIYQEESGSKGVAQRLKVDRAHSTKYMGTKPIQEDFSEHVWGHGSNSIRASLPSPTKQASF